VLTEGVAKTSHAHSESCGVPLASPIRPIGVVRSPFPTRMGTPRWASIPLAHLAAFGRGGNKTARQGVLAPSTRGWIQLDGKLNAAAALDGLQQFSHLWIVFVFHRNTNVTKWAQAPWVFSPIARVAD